MAKDNIEKPDPEVHGVAVTSITETVPSAADSTSAPNELPDDVNRPPVSTNEPQTPIAQTLVAGAGAPQPPDGPLPEDWQPDGKGGAEPKPESEWAGADKPATEKVDAPATSKSKDS